MDMTIVVTIVSVTVGMFVGYKLLSIGSKAEDYIDTKVDLATDIAKIDAAVARTKKLESVKKRYGNGLVSREKFSDFLESMELSD